MQRFRKFRNNKFFPFNRFFLPVHTAIFLSVLCSVFVSINSFAITSDDFSSTLLNTSLWTVEDPLMDAGASVNGTQLLISVPAGTSHDVWSSGNFAPRVMQPADDADFGIEVKFESALGQKYQMQGLLVEESPGNFLRFDFFSDGSSTRVFAAIFSSGVPSVKFNKSVTLSAPYYMRVDRVGNNWTQSYSADGVNWTTAVSFTHTLAVSAVGVFAGNAGSNAPAFTGVADYFFNTASPIVPEDGGGDTYVLQVSVSGSGAVTLDPDKVFYVAGETVTLTAEPAAGFVFESWGGDLSGTGNPITLVMDADKVVSATFSDPAAMTYSLTVTPVGSGTVQLDPPGGGPYPEGTTVQLTAVADAGWQFVDWSGEVSGTANPVSVLMDGNKAVTATFELDTIAPTISSVLVAPGSTTAVITWQTDEPATSQVDYGLTNAYGSMVEELALVTGHSITLANLAGDTEYHYQITSVDQSSNPASSLDLSFTTNSDPSGITSDDFSSTLLNTSLWTVEDPLMDADVSVNGTQLLISVPGGTSHDVWSSGNFAPRVMQPADDADFGIEVKFESALGQKYQMQGLLVEESPGNFLRFDFFSDGSSTRVFAAIFSSGIPSVKFNKAVTLSAPYYMRVDRVGNNWTQSYSADGVNWTTAASFTHALAVSAVGVFAGNAGSNAPAFTGVADYFFNTASPIVPEDGGGDTYVLQVSVSGSGAVTLDPDKVFYDAGETVTLTAEPAAGFVLKAGVVI